MIKKFSVFITLILTIALIWTDNSISATATLQSKFVKAGTPITIKGNISPNTDLYVVINSDTNFNPASAAGPKEKKKLSKKFPDVSIPPIYYVVTNVPETLATPQEAAKGQTSGIFAFPPFKYNVKVNKILGWDQITDDVKNSMLGPINTNKQWDFIRFTHENKFGINTISKELPIGGGNAR
ncbi:MAG: hypothetical protein OEM02_05505, partial [Desulfobulbaceae bacterium]|nr:hypothetical protein [Desulfobulbaceae bacterium]